MVPDILGLGYSLRTPYHNILCLGLPAEDMVEDGVVCVHSLL